VKPEDAEEYTQALGLVVAGGWRQIALGKRLGVPDALKLTTEEWVKGRLGGYVKLFGDERTAAVIELQAQNFTQREIAEITGLGLGTVNRGLNGVPDGTDEPSEPAEKPTISMVDVPNGTSEPLDVLTGLAATNEVRQAAEATVIREAKRRQVIADLEDKAMLAGKVAAGVYDVLVVDPPWPMERIERDKHPNEVGFDYPTMSEDEIRKLVLPMAEACHVWLWTTQRFLPLAFELLEAWGLKYVCTFVWHKPGGFQPFSLPQYNCEFALYARRGAPIFLDLKDFDVCFKAPRGKHSEKPEAFYETVRRVTGGRRGDMYNRREIAGFEGIGQEAP